MFTNNKYHACRGQKRKKDNNCVIMTKLHEIFPHPIQMQQPFLKSHFMRRQYWSNRIGLLLLLLWFFYLSVQFFFVHSKRTKANRVQIGCSFGKLFLSFILCHPPVVVVHLASLLISNKYVSAMNKILYVSEMKLACFALDNQPVKEAHRFHLFIRHFFIHLCYNCHVCVLSTQL